MSNKALIIVDYSFDFIDDNGKLTCGKPGQEIEFFGPEIESFKQVVDTIYDEEGNELDAARHPLQIVQIKVDKPIYSNNMMRKEIG